MFLLCVFPSDAKSVAYLSYQNSNNIVAGEGYTVFSMTSYLTFGKVLTMKRITVTVNEAQNIV